MKTCRLSVHCSLQVLALRRFLPAICIVLLTGLAVLPGHAAAQIFDDFEAYAEGSNLLGQGGWAGWGGNASAGALVSSNFAFSPTRSVNITGASDLVRTFSGATNGQWVFSVMQYIPSTSTGTNYTILLNTYRPPYGTADLNWSVQLQNNMTSGQIISYYGGGAALPMVKDRWVEVQCVINLDANSVSEFYNGQLLSTHPWQGSAGVPGLREIQALDLFADNAGPVYYDNVTLTPQNLVITVDIGRRSQGCTGFGICSITIDPLASTRPVPTAATWANGRLQLNFLADPPNKGTLLTIDQDIVLDSATARALGYEQVTVRAGQYPVDYSVNPHGQVSPDVTALGIVITIDCRRHCTGGFGFCSITIDASASARAVPTAATWGNGRLQLSFLAEPPDKTNVLILDDDIVLDSATSRALGYEQVTVRAGQYPVDFSVNPHGQVSPDVTAQGLIIWVRIGRPSQGCTGFGFCGMGTGTPPFDRAVQAAAGWANGQLHLNFLADPPDMGSLLTIEQDIVLDSATSRGLGYQQVIVRAGQYPVDYATNPHGEVSPNADGLIIWIQIGRPTQGCTGFGLCGIGTGNPPTDRVVEAAAQWSNGRLQLSFLSEPPDKTNVFVLDQDVVLDSATARLLGYEHVTLRAGQYPVDYSVNPRGQVSPDVIAQGIVITIDCRRHCQGGFGFCSITIDWLASARAVPTAATWANGRLQLSFLAEPPDKTNVLILDEDIVLDSATSRALGYEHVTVRAGQYPVDYSVNPYGQVSPDVTALGIVITIDCRRHCTSGFGFCSLTIDASASARAVPTAATWANGRLQLSFLAEPPDKTNVLILDNDIVLDSATSRALGYEQVTVRAGQYPVDYSANPHGVVSPDTTASGIIIRIRVGLGSCRPGFGICEIYIGPSTSLRDVPAAATWVNGHLQLSFLADPPDKASVLTLEQDVVLDSAASQALGHQQVILHAGQYAVDYSTNPHGVVSPSTTVQGFIIWVKIGIPKAGGCVPGLGICGIGTGNPPFDRAVPAAANWVNGRLQLDFLSDPPEKTSLLTLEQDVVLDSATARSLGYEQLTVRAGQYPVDYSVTPHGHVSPDVTARGIIITIYTGFGPGCTDFGICRITIDTSASARTVQAAATWVNGRLQLNYLADPPDKGTLLTIDQDIVLDSATARSLGYEHVTLRAGQYPVDYSVNPHGQVSPDVTAQGLTIWVKIGIPQAGGCVPGFGICGIGVGNPPFDRTVQAAATWIAGALQLSFLSAPPDSSTVLTLEQDFVLDSASAQSLGYEHVTLRAGQYPVAYSVNPYGQVSLDATTQGQMLSYAGLPHTSLGSAVLTATDTRLTVSNLGSSGQDGVEINLKGTHRVDAQWLDPDPAGTLPVGAYVQSQIIGTAGSVVNGVLGSAQITKAAGGSYLMTADFSALGTSRRTVEVYRYGNLVARVTGQTGPVGTCSSISWDVSWECCPSKWDWSFELGASLALNGGPTVVGDRVLLIPEGPLATIEQTAGRILVSQIPSLTITNETVQTLYGGLDHSPLGTATLFVKTNGTGTNGLIISNLGSSGLDGVEISFPSVDKWHAHWLDPDAANSLAIGAFVQSTARGLLGGLGMAQQSLGSVRVQKSGTQSYDVSADFSPLGASTRTVEAYYQGALVARVTGQSGPVGRASSFYVSADMESSCCPWTLTLSVDWGSGAGTAMTLNGGPTVVVDHLFITPEGGTPLLDRPAAIWLQSAQIPSLELTQEVAQVRFGGVLHSALGDAALTVVSNRLEVSNLGSSGQDGVSIAMPSTSDWGAQWLDLDPNSHAPVGAYLREQIVGTGGGVVNGVLGTVQITKTGTGTCAVVPDFSPMGVSTYTMQVYSGSTLVSQLTGQSGSALSCPGFSLDIRIQCCPWKTEVSFDLSTSLALRDGKTVTGDRVYFIPEGAPSLGFPSAVRIQASQIPAITVVSEAATVVRPVLSSTVSGNNLTLRWIGGGVLQECTSLGVWSDLVGAASPCTVPVSRPTPKKFYRVRQ